MSSPLYDLFKSIVKKPTESRDQILEHPEMAVLDKIFLSSDVYVTTNVTEYFFAGTDQEFWYIDKHFPNLAPVADSFWLETKAPTHIRSKIHGVQGWEDQDYKYLYARPKRWAAWFINVGSEELIETYGDGLPQAFEERFGERPFDKVWVYAVTLFIQRDEHLLDPVWSFTMFVDKETGLAIKNPAMAGYDPFFFRSEPSGEMQEEVAALTARYGDTPLLKVTGENDKNPMAITAFQAYEHEAITLLKPLLFALSLMHCKNVKRVPVVPSPQQNKKRILNHRPPFNKFHTLEIRVMQDIIHQAARNYRGAHAAGDEIGMALHTVRGHFKTYTAEKPLMGHAVGRWFWPKHAAGTKKRGEVKKHYTVKP